MQTRSRGPWRPCRLMSWHTLAFMQRTLDMQLTACLQVVEPHQLLRQSPSLLFVRRRNAHTLRPVYRRELCGRTLSDRESDQKSCLRPEAHLGAARRTFQGTCQCQFSGYPPLPYDATCKSGRWTQRGSSFRCPRYNTNPRSPYCHHVGRKDRSSPAGSRCYRRLSRVGL